MGERRWPLRRLAPARLSLVLLLGALMVAGCSDDDRGDNALPTSSTVPREDLYGAQVATVDGEVWVFGGHAAAEGTSPPVTSIVPPGWEPNRSVVAYSPAGEVARRYQLPDGLDGAVFSGSVFSQAGAHHLLGTLCDLAGGCATYVEPALFRLDGTDAERIVLHLPNPPDDEGAGVGHLTPLGASDGTAWALQLLTQQGTGYAGFADRHRLLGIDLTSGSATEIDLPTDIYGEEFVCMSGDDLFAAQAVFDDDAVLREARIMRRAATTDGAAWEPFVVLPLEPRPVYAGSLSCLEALDELFLTLGPSPTDVFTFDGTTGVATTQRAALAGRPRRVLGVVDGTAVAVASGESDELVLWRHRRGSPWDEGRDVRLPDPLDLLVVGDRVLDVSGVRSAIGPDSVPLPEVDV